MPELNILKNNHIMLAPYEKHDALLPPTAIPAPSLPHSAGVVPLKWGPWGALTGKTQDDVLHDGGTTVLRGSDIGPLIPHICWAPPLHYLLPIIILTSGSKSHFCSPRDHAGGEPKAVALLKVVNLNLNCCGATWPPLPLGFVLAFWSTRTTDVSWAELGKGFLHMVFDLLLQFAINRLLGLKGVSNFSNRILNATLGRLALRSSLLARVMNIGGGRSAASTISTALDDGIMKVIPAAAQPGRLASVSYELANSIGHGLIGQAPAVLTSLVVGTPLGYGQPTVFEDTPVGMGSTAVGNYLNPAQVEQHPSSAPASSGAADGGPSDAGAPGGGAPSSDAPDGGGPDVNY